MTPIPCDFCGAAPLVGSLLVSYHSPGRKGPQTVYRVQCACGAHGKCRPDKESAVAAWNEPWQALPAPAWRPIETAPMDGTPLLLFARCKHATAPVVLIGWYMPDMGWIECTFYPNKPQGIVPTHWMPRPPFPGEALTPPQT